MSDLEKKIDEIKSIPEDWNLISHIPPKFLSVKKLTNFQLARREEKAKKIKLESLPYHYVVEPTNACNLKCPLCPTGLGILARSKGVLNFNQFKDIVDRIADHCLSLYLQNWGEATLVKDICSMVKYASDKGIWCHISTNFSRPYKDSFLEDLMLSGLGYLHIDLDGTTQEVYEEYRQKGKLDLVISNTKKIVEIKKRNNLEFPIIETSMLLMRHNENQKEEFLDLAKSLNVDKFSVDRIQVNPNTSKKWLPSDQEYIYNTYKGAKRNQPCHWPWSGFVINWDGNISACCIVDDPDADFGNIFESNIKELWNNPYFISARSEFSESQDVDFSQNTICNICKNETHNPNLRRIGDSFAIALPRKN